jgi:2-dehydropantoate 2-reductase
MRIVVVGSGGVGGYFGAKLARAGEEVTFVARGAHLQAIRERGLRIRSAAEGEWCVKAPAVATLDGHAPADLVLFCVKSYDTEEAARLVRPAVGPLTGILSLQNGVDNEERLERVLGAGHVMGGVTWVFSKIEAPGVIAHQQTGRIVFGEMNGTPSVRATAFAEACRRASIQAEMAPDIRGMLWQKYVFLTAFAGATALTRLPARYLRDVPEVHRLWRLQLEELLALAEAERVGLDPGVMDRSIKYLDGLAPTNYSSLYHDLVQGKRLELDALHGHAVNLSERHRVPTPTLFAVYAALRPYRDGVPKLAA